MAWQYAGDPICTGNFIPGLNSNDTAVCCTLTGCATIGDGDGGDGGDGGGGDGDGGDGDMGAFLPTVHVF